MNARRSAGLLFALATATISGVAIFLNSNGVRAYGGAAPYTTAKNLVAALVLGLAFAATPSRRRARLTRPSSPRGWAGLVAVAVVGGSVPFVLFFEGLARAEAAQAAFLHKSLVVWVALLALVVLRERVTGVHLCAIALLIAGQVGLNGGVAGLAATLSDPGSLMVLGATLLWSVEVVISKRLLAGMTEWTLSLARMGGGAVVLIAWAAITGTTGAVVPSTAAQWGWVLITGALLAGYVATWHRALARAQAVDVTAVLVAGAFITAALSGVFRGVDLLPALPWHGLILAGTALVAWRMRAQLGRGVRAPA